MIYAILISIILGLAFYVWVLYTSVEELKYEKKQRGLGEGEILPIVQNSEEIVYYRDYYTEDGQEWALHTVGAKGWSFQQCKEFGIVITTWKVDQQGVGSDILKYMISAYARDTERYRIDTEANAAAFEAAKETETTVTSWEENNEPIDQ